MGLGKLAKAQYKDISSVLGIDASTTSFAFCLFEDGRPVRWGEIKFKGASAFERLAYGQRFVKDLSKKLESDLVVFESAVYVQNKKTVILLAYAFGALVAPLVKRGTRGEEISPLVWQRAIGNKALTKAEKDAIKAEFPGKSKTWYQAKNRELRKGRTMQWVEDTYGITVESDNVSDAIAIASVAYDTYVVDGGKQ